VEVNQTNRRLTPGAVSDEAAAMGIFRNASLRSPLSYCRPCIYSIV